MSVQILTISISLAFLFSGLAQVVTDLRRRGVDKPGWAIRPSIPLAFMVGITWFLRPILDGYALTRQKARATAFGILGALIQITVLTSCFFGAILLANIWFDSNLIRIIFVATIFIIGAPFILPIASILIIPLTLLLSLPLDLFFPLRKLQPLPLLRWCRTCKHYRKSREYEETFNGAWAAEKMPRSDLLPCKIVMEAIDTWSEFYGRERSEKTLFPKNCARFEQA